MEIIIAVAGLYAVFKLMQVTLPAHIEPEAIERAVVRSEYRSAARKYR